MIFPELVKVLYTVPVPYAFEHDDVIEVYGEPEMGWYEWRVVRLTAIPNGYGKPRAVLKDSKDVGYGCAEIALRDALVEMSKDL